MVSNGPEMERNVLTVARFMNLWCCEIDKHILKQCPKQKYMEWHQIKIVSREFFYLQRKANEFVDSAPSRSGCTRHCPCSRRCCSNISDVGIASPDDEAFC